LAQIATLIIKVDLHCCTCSKKINKVLCKLQNRFDIQSIVYDEKNNTVTVSGPFNPECFIRKLRCLACKVIKDIQIKPKPAPSTPPKSVKPSSPKPKKPPPLEVVVKGPVCVFPPSAWPSPPLTKPKPVPSPPLTKPPVCVFPPPGWPNCCYQPCPCYEPRNGCRRCCSCGWVCDGPPPSAACRPCNQVDGCKIVLEQEPCQSCSIM
ncbi:unnamed protein product, partial [Musa textilis]